LASADAITKIRELFGGPRIHESGVPDLYRNSYIKENGQFWLMPLPADDFLMNFSQKAVAAGNVTWADVLEERKAKLRSK